MTNFFRAGLITLAGLGTVNNAHGLKMPEQISTVSLGMRIDAFAPSHPNAKLYGIDFVGPVDPSKLANSSAHIEEDLPKGSVFSRAAYFFQEGQLVTVELRGNAPKGKEKKVRQDSIRKFVGKWGSDFQKRVLEDPAMLHQRLVALVWMVDDSEIELVLPRNPTKTEFGPMRMTLNIRASSFLKKYPRKELLVELAHREALFKANDLR